MEHANLKRYLNFFIVMKNYYSIVFFSYSVLFDNISDFEIDGISIGDSL